MEWFWTGVISSIAASGLLAALGWTLSPTARRKVRRMVLKGVNAGVLDSFETQRAAAGEIANHLRTARSIRILSGRGNELQRETFQALWSNEDHREVTILLPDPEKSGPGSWIEDHQREALEYDGGQGDRMILENISNNVEYVKNRMRRADRITLALYDMPVVARLVMTEKLVFITPYSNRRHGADSPCVLVAAGHPLYDLADRLFLKYRQASRTLGAELRGPASGTGSTS